MHVDAPSTRLNMATFAVAVRRIRSDWCRTYILVASGVGVFGRKGVLLANQFLSNKPPGIQTRQLFRTSCRRPEVGFSGSNRVPLFWLCLGLLVRWPISNPRGKAGKGSGVDGRKRVG